MSVPVYSIKTAITGLFNDFVDVFIFEEDSVATTNWGGGNLMHQKIGTV